MTKDEMLEPYDWGGNIDMMSIVLIGIKNELPEHDEKYELHRLLGALLSDELTVNEKLDIIEKEYDIPVEDDLERTVSLMCNLSESIEEKGVTKATERIVINMLDKNFTLEQVALATELSVDEIKKIAEKRQPVMA